MNPEQLERRGHEALVVRGSYPITATSDGSGNGKLPPHVTHATVGVTTDANDQVTLPSNVIGHRVTLVIGATGAELICADAAAKINNVVCGATNEAALTADSHYLCECISATEWIVRGVTALGADQAALVPDAL